jgi:1-deoxy-D-xylulose-5-phosphate reductoisomerase
VSEPRGIVLLGSTGSIGRQTLDVVRALPGRFRVVGLAAGANAQLLVEQVAEFRPDYACCRVDGAALGAARLSMEEMVALPGVDVVVVATTSTSALAATLRGLELGRTVATANKEVLVAAGEIVVAAARRHGARLLPIDSEHSAIWQCLRGEGGGELVAPPAVRRVALTASGGAFRDLPLDQLASVEPAQALRHPVWRMGAKITIDSATLVNKAFEVIEARWLFDLADEQIDVVLHREGVVRTNPAHSFVDVNRPPDTQLRYDRHRVSFPALHAPRSPKQDRSRRRSHAFHRSATRSFADPACGKPARGP